MAAVDMRADLSLLVDAVTSGNIDQIIAAARDYLQQDKSADTLIGRLAMIAAYGDSEGHRTITLAAAAMLARLTHWIPAPVEEQAPSKERALPIFVQALKVASPIMPAGQQASAHATFPHPLFPSELLDTGKTMTDILREAVAKNDAELAERALLGFYGTGADYRTLQMYTYEAVANTFQNGGHPLIFAVRGFQLLDAVEWGNQVPHIVHWLAPHLPLPQNTDEPDWIRTVRSHVGNSTQQFDLVRKRLSSPKDENALPLRSVILSDADTTTVCQEVSNALVKGEASPQAIAAVIALAAADVIQRTGDNDREQFIRASHGLLYASAVGNITRQIRNNPAVFGVLFTAAAAINALQKTVAGSTQTTHASSSSVAAGGLIAASQLETLKEELKAQNIKDATATAQRYLKVGHDARALFGTIGLAAALLDAESDQGHSLQIVQAAAEEYLNWPRALHGTSTEAFLHIALRAALFGKRDAIVSSLYA